jgi:hypothetical protein
MVRILPRQLLVCCHTLPEELEVLGDLGEGIRFRVLGRRNFVRWEEGASSFLIMIMQRMCSSH